MGLVGRTITTVSKEAPIILHLRLLGNTDTTLSSQATSRQCASTHAAAPRYAAAPLQRQFLPYCGAASTTRTPVQEGLPLNDGHQLFSSPAGKQGSCTTHASLRQDTDMAHDHPAPIRYLLMLVTRPLFKGSQYPPSG